LSFRIPLNWEPYRTKIPGYERGNRRNGAFTLPARSLAIIVSDGLGWEHASVSHPDRTPTWEEMEFVKQELWGPDVTVMQLHVPAKDHVNFHPFCLHLWRPVTGDIPRPDAIMVGPK
jgi:hypothetical protein